MAISSIEKSPLMSINSSWDEKKEEKERKGKGERDRKEREIIKTVLTGEERDNNTGSASLRSTLIALRKKTSGLTVC